MKNYTCIANTKKGAIVLGSNLTLTQSLSMAHNHANQNPNLICSYTHSL